MNNIKDYIMDYIRTHKKQVLIALAVLLALLVLMIAMIGRECGNHTAPEPEQTEKEKEISSYFRDSDYPVKASTVGNNIRITLEGNKLSEQDWLVDTSASGVVTIVKEDESGSVLITPENIGYTTVTFRQASAVGDLNYDIVRIDADIMVFTRDETSAVNDSYSDPNVDLNTMNQKTEILYTELKDIRLNTASSGAQDSETPYLLQDDKVILPKGGDWTLTTYEEEKYPEGLYSILYVTSDTEIGCPYYEVRKNPEFLINEDGTLNEENINSCLLLKSESLGIEKKLVCEMNNERIWILSEKEESANENTASS